ncbi:DNA helicase UvrD [Serratia fonticola]|uniref:DNA helicase UvrD n=1 Tax=Serratia fonticola TaxID=47917 RepID=UPI0015C5BC1F|nr:DNA helicase UvrD [Serratia fonticola]NYA46127.1 DNA helicase UvrD [Serratia fonticola]
MDKRVIFAVAGSGKTTLLIDRLTENSRTLILTHTVNNETHLRAKIISRFGLIPNGIRVMTWFEFLHCFCFRPFLQEQLATHGLNFSQPLLRLPRTHPLHYQDSRGRLYHRRLAQLLTARGLLPDICNRLARYYDEFLADEVQDFGGHDFNFLLALCNADVSVLFAGDFYQHTFDTSRDGNVNSTLHDNIASYEARFEAAGVTPDRETLSRTWRCSTTVCEFITGQLNIRIDAHRTHGTLIETVTDPERVATLHADNAVIKLFYREHHRYYCQSLNWGASKGLDHFHDVCIVMGAEHWRLLNRQELHALPPSSRNKLYVACSRARGNIYFVPETHLRKFKR